MEPSALTVKRSLLAIVFILDVPHDLLQQVLDGYQAGCAAVFVDDDRQMDTFALELLKELLQVLGFGDEVGGAHDGAHLDLFIRLPPSISAGLWRTAGR